MDSCLKKTFSQAGQAKPGTKHRIRCGPIPVLYPVPIQKRHTAPNPSRRRRTLQRRVHRRGPVAGRPRNRPPARNLSAGCSERHVKHARTPGAYCPAPSSSSSTRRATLLPRCPYARRRRRRRSRTRVRKHHGNLSHFLGFQPCGRAGASNRWKASVCSGDGLRAGRHGLINTGGRAGAGRRRCRRPFHPLVGAVRRRSRSRNGPRVCCSHLRAAPAGRRRSATEPSGVEY